MFTKYFAHMLNEKYNKFKNEEEALKYFMKKLDLEDELEYNEYLDYEECRTILKSIIHEFITDDDSNYIKPLLNILIDCSLSNSRLFTGERFVKFEPLMEFIFKDIDTRESVFDNIKYLIEKYT